MPALPRVAVISDDLTGALDATAPFAECGWRGVVALTADAMPEAMRAGADLVAVSLNSREIPQEQAVRAAGAMARMVLDVPVVFKKIDSRLKGHVAAEVAAIAEGLGLRRVILCPAIPALGRRVTGGLVTGFGIETPIAVTGMNLPGLLVTTPDADSDAALDEVVADLPPDALLVGARGLSAALARKLCGAARPAPPTTLPLPVTIVVGSRDPITLAQIEALCADLPDVALLRAPNGRIAATSTAAIRIVQAVPGTGAVSGAEVAETLADSFCRTLARGTRSLVLTGGETAAAVLRRMGIRTLQLLGEVAPGLPLSRPLDFPSELLIITKSGGFGDRDVLSKLFDAATAASGEGL